MAGSLALSGGLSLSGWDSQYDIRRFGAKVDGVTDDTTAWALAFASGQKLITMPIGTSVCAPSTFTGINGITVAGVHKRLSKISFTGSNTSGWTFTNCAFTILSDIMFQKGSSTNLHGVTFNGTSGGSEIRRCIFWDFDGDGLQLIGTVSSGDKVLWCEFLGCKGRQLYASTSMDFWYEGNQFGVIDRAATHPQYGAYLDNCDAGHYTRNVHWENVVGFAAVNGSSYNRVEVNRFEENAHEGVILDTGGAYNIFLGNTIHTNSKNNVGLYASCVFNGQTYLTVQGNQVFDWTNVSQHTFSYVFGAGCDNLTVKGNKANNFATAPFSIHSSLNGANWNPDAVLPYLSGATVPANTTLYLGTNGQSTISGGVAHVLGRRCAAFRIYLACTAAPGGTESFVATLENGGVATSLSTSISGSGFSNSAVLATPTLFTQNQSADIKLVSSAAAVATATLRGAVQFLEY